MLPTPHDRHERVVPVAFLGAWLGRFDGGAGDIGRARRGEGDASALGTCRVGRGSGAGARPLRGDGAATLERAVWIRCSSRSGAGARRWDGAAVTGAWCGGGRHGFTGGGRGWLHSEGQQQHGDEQGGNSSDTHGAVLSLQIANVETIIARFGIAR